MNISITKTGLLILGFILLIAGVFFGIDAMRSTDLESGIYALIGIIVGFALVSGQGVNLSA